jgi:outer membrane protein OmpA-like peptidoglycan-associated protein
MTFGRSAATALLALAASAVLAQPAEPDPDSPEVRARAAEALSRAQRLPITTPSAEIIASTVEIVGISSGVEGTAIDLKGALRDLGAKVTEQEIRIEIAADVLFDFDKADLRKEARPSLEKVATVLKAYPKASGTVEGHTDAKGNDQYNQKLSERRAQTVRKWLADNGVTTKLSTRGYGKTKPVASNTKPDGKDDPEGRQKNRRVEIVVKTS